MPIIVAVNKIDLPEANPDRVKTQLSELGLIPEEWGGGTTQFVEVSAFRKRHSGTLRCDIAAGGGARLESEFRQARGRQDFESRIDQGRGIVLP